jgi:hypothetical protein
VVNPSAGNLSVQLAKEVLRPYAVGVHAAALDDQGDGAAESDDLPIVYDPAEWIYHSRSGTFNWYQPTFEVLAPAPNEDASTSPFLYSFKRIGATASGLPGLEAAVTIRLRASLGAEARAALSGSVTARSIPTLDTQVVLDLPFRDANGANQRQRFPAQTNWDSDVLTASVSLLDDWARLAYGAFSQPGFQVEPARVAVTWSFSGWQKTEIDLNAIVWGGKSALLPIRYHPPRTIEGTVETRSPHNATFAYLDAPTATYRGPIGDYQFRARSLPKGTVAATVVPTLSIHAELTGPGAADRQNSADVSANPVPTRAPAGLHWMRRTFLRSEVRDVIFPCAEFGSCYVEERAEGAVAIGCQDALQLGQAIWRQYEEIAAFRDAWCQVFRSLQQPGHFVALPRRFVLGRYSSTHPTKPCQPAILLYALLSPDEPSTNQVVIQATLQPDVPPYVWAGIQARLRAYASGPTLTLATDVECVASFVWTVVGIPSVNVSTVLSPGGISLSIQSDLAHALLLRDMLSHDGLTGALTLKLPDGTLMESSLTVGLTDLAGPSPRGPIDVLVTSSATTLINTVERAVNVTALRIDSGSETLREVPVEQTLAPGVAITLPPTAASADSTPPDASSCWPVYSVPPAPPATLQEVRTFVEDIHMNVVFMDLVDHATHGHARLDVRAELMAASTVQEVTMTGAPASGTASFILPLTAYLSQRIVRYQVTVIRDGLSTDSPWLRWDVATAGCLIGLTWESLGIN